MRLGKLESEYGGELEVVWKSFMLRPSPHPRSLAEHREYTRNWLVPAGQPEPGEFTVWATDEDPPTHSVPALIAGKAAATFGEEAFRRFHLEVMRAYFKENRDISDPGVLSEVAVRSGVPAGEFEERLGEGRDAFEGEVFAEHQEAVSLGVTGIPSVVVDDALLVPGAVEREVYREVIRERQALR